MQPALNNKKILLGISGGIAAYKTPELVRMLKKQGADVQVVLTEGGKEFVSELALQAVSEYPVYSHVFENSTGAMRHIELARWADIILIAPATANRMAALAHGLADDLLTNLCLGSNAPLIIVPAMNKKMWFHPATQANLKILKAFDTILNWKVSKLFTVLGISISTYSQRLLSKAGAPLGAARPTV